jgi:hypothetical protein
MRNPSARDGWRLQKPNVGQWVDPDAADCRLHSDETGVWTVWTGVTGLELEHARGRLSLTHIDEY